jgi:DDE superfamily endonuclease
MYEPLGVLSAVNDLSQFLNTMGVSYHKARFGADHQDPARRREWWAQQWPAVLHLATGLAASSRCGDDASLPQWGTLTYTWAQRGHHPTVQTSGLRQGDTVFGLVADCSGRFVYQGHAGRFTSERYAQLLEAGLQQTTPPSMLLQDGARYHTSQALQECFATPVDRLPV